MTIAQQLEIKDFPFIIKDKDGNKIYHEFSNGYWRKYKYDTNGREVSFENSDGVHVKSKYDASGNMIYRENANGYWVKRKRNINGRIVSFEDSDGYWSIHEYDTNGELIYYKNSDRVRNAFGQEGER